MSTEPWFHTEQNNDFAVQVGNIVSEGNGVRYRLGQSLLWKDVPKHFESVSVGDAIFTNEKGNASLQFNQGAKIKIEQNSLVIVSKIKSDQNKKLDSVPVLNIKKGKISLNFTNASQSVFIQAKGKIYKIENKVERNPASAQDVQANELTVEFNESASNPIQIVSKNNSKPIQVEEITNQVKVEEVETKNDQDSNVSEVQIDKESISNREIVEKTIVSIPKTETIESPKTEIIVSKDLIEKTGELMLAPIFGFSAFTVQDLNSSKSASVYSKEFYGLNVEWKSFFKNKNSAVVQIGYKIYDLNQTTTGGKLSNLHPGYWNFAVGYGSQLSNPLSIALLGGLSQSLTLSALNASIISVDTITIPKFSIHLKYTLLNSNHSKYNLISESSALLPGFSNTYRSKFGYSQGLAIGHQHRLSNNNFEFSLGLKYEKFKTTFSSSTESTILLNIGIYFDLFTKTQLNLDTNE